MKSSIPERNIDIKYNLFYSGMATCYINTTKLPTIFIIAGLLSRAPISGIPAIPPILNPLYNT